MSQLALVGISTVGGGPGATSAGLITGPGDIAQFDDGSVQSLVGDLIATHGPAPHIGATIISGSPDTFGYNGAAVVRVGDQASCGCTVLAGDFDAFCV